MHHHFDHCPGPRSSASQFAAWQPCTPKKSIGAETQEWMGLGQSCKAGNHQPMKFSFGRQLDYIGRWIKMGQKLPEFFGPNFGTPDSSGSASRTFQTTFSSIQYLDDPRPFDDRQGDLLNRIERHHGEVSTGKLMKTASHVLLQSRNGRVCSNMFAM